MCETQHGQVKETPSFGKMLSVISNGHRITGPTVTVLGRDGWGRCEVRTAGSRGQGFGNSCNV